MLHKCVQPKDGVITVAAGGYIADYSCLRATPRLSIFWEDMNPTIFGVALKFIGASWLMPSILFAVGWGLLVVWRPRSNFGFSTTAGTV